MINIQSIYKLINFQLRQDIGPQCLSFPAYSKNEISDIISFRLQSVSTPSQELLLNPAAIDFLSAKISSFSGDIRKALDICRRAIELEEIRSRFQTSHSKSQSQSSTFKPINVPQIMTILNKIYTTNGPIASLKMANSDLPIQQKILIAAILLMTNKNQPKKETTIGKLHQTYSKLCNKRDMCPMNITETISLCDLLEAGGFFSIRRVHGKKLSCFDMKVSLVIDESEVEAALKDKTLLSSILKDRDCICN